MELIHKMTKAAWQRKKVINMDWCGAFNRGDYQRWQKQKYENSILKHRIFSQWTNFSSYENTVNQLIFLHLNQVDAHIWVAEQRTNS